MEKERAIVKYNGGLGCILCSKCRKILKIGREFTPEETKYIRGELEYDLPPQYCDQCVIKDTNTKDNVEYITHYTKE